MKRTTILLIFSGAGIVIFFSFLAITIPKMLSNAHCYSEKRALELEITNGVLFQKFNDTKNHNYKTIRFTDNGEMKESLVFVHEKSGCYDFLNEGDSLFKKKDTLVFCVKRNGESNFFTLEYNCLQ